MIKHSRTLAIIGLVMAVVVVMAWQSGWLAGIEQWAAERQREFQALMARALRGLRAGDQGATIALMGICFGYGFLHAVGPGHGKVLIGGYGYGAKVPLGRLAIISVLASLAQALMAVVLVAAGVTLLGLSREALTGLSEDLMADVSALMIGLVGLWLALRGAMQLIKAGKGRGHATRHLHDHPHEHHHHHHHEVACGCGHAHGPSVEEVARTHSLRDAIALIAGIAIRPCTGAVFLLLLTWRMGFFATGIAGAFAMGLGTASVTLMVACLSVWAREGSLALFADNGRLATFGRWLPGVMQLGAGLIVVIVAMALLRLI